MPRFLLVLVPLLAGCLPPGEPVDRRFADVEEPVPLLTEASVDCDLEAGRWRVELTTAGWTGGATSAWTTDGEYVELHELIRTAWAEDGTQEDLTLTLAIAEDFLEVEAGSSTAFTCGQDPSGVVEVRDRSGEVVDCRAWGPEPTLFDGLEDVPTCDVLLERTR